MELGWGEFNELAHIKYLTDTRSLQALFFTDRQVVLHLQLKRKMVPGFHKYFL